mmetsp:Transcript_6361/g.13383  ORF Transcript_6361/g.13383 Transcript_6361/m.13383 type:complete len:87 (-) Transcript_6361:69-329(-)
MAMPSFVVTIFRASLQQDKTKTEAVTVVGSSLLIFCVVLFYDSSADMVVRCFAYIGLSIHGQDASIIFGSGGGCFYLLTTELNPNV